MSSLQELSRKARLAEEEVLGLVCKINELGRGFRETVISDIKFEDRISDDELHNSMDMEATGSKLFSEVYSMKKTIEKLMEAE